MLETEPNPVVTATIQPQPESPHAGSKIDWAEEVGIKRPAQPDVGSKGALAEDLEAREVLQGDPGRFYRPLTTPRTSSSISSFLLREIGRAKNILRELQQDGSQSATDLEELIASLEVLRGRFLVHADATRIILATTDGRCLERGACPGQVWPTANPLNAVNWPDVPTALEALTSRAYVVAKDQAERSGYRLRRVVVFVEDLADGEIERGIQELAQRSTRDQAAGRAVAG